MTQSRLWNQLLYRCALLRICDIIIFSNDTFPTDVLVHRSSSIFLCKILEKEMGPKLVILLILFMLIAQSKCQVPIPDNAYRKYSFVYISVTFFTAVLCFEMVCVKQRIFISEMSSCTLFGKITLRWDWGICNSSFKVLMWLYAFLSYVKLHPLIMLP